MTRRVVVTGLGLVTPVGNSVEETWSALMSGRSGADHIKKFDATKFPVRFACEIKDFDPLKYVEKKDARKMGALRFAPRKRCDDPVAFVGEVDLPKRRCDQGFDRAAMTLAGPHAHDVGNRERKRHCRMLR